MARYDYQYLVIGSGAAGSAAALMAAKMGHRTAIVEADRLGGSTLNYRDIPYAAGLGFEQLYNRAIEGAKFGMSSASLRYNYPTVLNWQATAVKRAGGNSRKVFEEAGVECYHGFAQFISSHVIAVGDKQISSDKFLIATGTNIAVNGIAGIDSVSCWSPNTALRMAKLPKNLVIIGGGSTGCELAEYFSVLGVSVALIEAQERLLPREDPEVSEVMEKHLHNELGVKLLLNSRAIALEQMQGNVQQVVFIRGSQEKTLQTEAIVLATTPEPSTDLGLENAGVKFSYRGVDVNQNLRTSNGHIWAAGDVIGGESSTEKATYEGKLATLNALQNAGNIVNYTGFTRMTNTMPRVAKVGLNEIECKQIRQKVKSAVVKLSEISAANTSDFREGFVKILINPKQQIIGATVVCPEADLAIQEIAMAVRSGFKVTELAGTPHVATGWSEAVRMAARELSD